MPGAQDNQNANGDDDNNNNIDLNATFDSIVIKNESLQEIKYKNIACLAAVAFLKRFLFTYAGDILNGERNAYGIYDFFDALLRNNTQQN